MCGDEWGDEGESGWVHCLIMPVCKTVQRVSALLFKKLAYFRMNQHHLITSWTSFLTMLFFHIKVIPLKFNQDKTLELLTREF